MIAFLIFRLGKVAIWVKIKKKKKQESKKFLPYFLGVTKLKTLEN